MPRSLDPAIVALTPDPTKRTNLIVKIETAAPRLWTPFPDGLVIDNETYHPLGVEVEGIVESLDGPAFAATITIPTLEGAASDLATNAANLKKPVTIHRVHFNADWQYAGKELFFRGETGQPRVGGGFLVLACVPRTGRKGQAPFREWSEVMTAHRPPENARVAWGWRR